MKVRVHFRMLKWQEKAEKDLENDSIKAFMAECGVHSGKTDFFSAKLVQWMQRYPGASFWWGAQIKWQLDKMWGLVAPIMRRIGARLRTFPYYEIDCANGATLQTATAKNMDMLSTVHPDFMFMDEAAKVSQKQGELIWLRSVNARKFIPFSTPRPSKHWLQWAKEAEQGLNGWGYAHCTTRESGLVDAATEARIRAGLTANMAAQELDAMRVAADGNVFRFVDEAATLDEARPGKDKNGRPFKYLLSFDPAKHHDLSAIAIWRQRKMKFAEAWPIGMDYTMQVELVGARAREWNCADVVIDATGPGEAVYEMLVKESRKAPKFNVFPYHFNSNADKAALVNKLIMAFEQRSIGLIKPTAGDVYLEVVNEFKGYEQQRSGTGLNYIYSAPDGMYDDFVSTGLLMMVFENTPQVEILDFRKRR